MRALLVLTALALVLATAPGPGPAEARASDCRSAPPMATCGEKHREIAEGCWRPDGGQGKYPPLTDEDAVGVAVPGGSMTVYATGDATGEMRFYEEANGIEGLQPTSGVCALFWWNAIARAWVGPYETRPVPPDAGFV